MLGYNDWSLVNGKCIALAYYIGSFDWSLAIGIIWTYLSVICDSCVHYILICEIWGKSDLISQRSIVNFSRLRHCYILWGFILVIWRKWLNPIISLYNFDMIIPIAIQKLRFIFISYSDIALTLPNNCFLPALFWIISKELWPIVPLLTIFGCQLSHQEIYRWYISTGWIDSSVLVCCRGEFLVLGFWFTCGS